MRILLIRTSALGDIVHCLPVLTALRRQLPRAHIGWVVEDVFAPLLAGHPDLDELLVTRLRRWRRPAGPRRTAGELRRFLEQLIDFGADVVLDLMGNHKGGALAAFSLCDRRVGLARAFRREPSSSVWINRPVRPAGRHAVDRALSLLDPLGLPPAPADFGGDKLCSEVPAAAHNFFARHPEPYLLVQPGAGWGNKRYPVERWGEVARRLRSSTGLDVFAVGGPGEEALVAGVESNSGGAAAALPAADFPTLVALLRRAQLVLGGDTGPVHLAHALGAPTLCLMGPTNPERHGPYRALERVLFRRLPCSFCHQRMSEPRACMLEIPLERVVETAHSLLARVDRSAPAV